MNHKEKYRVWLATSPEWAETKIRIKLRATRDNGQPHCERCQLHTHFGQVHHGDSQRGAYPLGWLPPDWCLKYLCKGCHEAVHGISPETLEVINVLRDTTQALWRELRLGFDCL